MNKRSQERTNPHEERPLEHPPIYPTISWIRRQIRHCLYAPRRVTILEGYVIGSEARGTARSDSDLDIALVIPPVRGKSSLQYTEAYHQKFKSDQAKPHWNGRRLDLQFFYPSDEELASYSKIPLKP